MLRLEGTRNGNSSSESPLLRSKMNTVYNMRWIKLWIYITLSAEQIVICKLNRLFYSICRWFRIKIYVINHVQWYSVLNQDSNTKHWRERDKKNGRFIVLHTNLDAFGTNALYLQYLQTAPTYEHTMSSGKESFEKIKLLIACIYLACER